MAFTPARIRRRAAGPRLPLKRRNLCSSPAAQLGYDHCMRVEMEFDPRRFIGPGLLLAGWVVLVIAVAAFSSQGARTAVVILGLLVELVGFGFFVAHRSQSSGDRH